MRRPTVIYEPGQCETVMYHLRSPRACARQAAVMMAYEDKHRFVCRQHAKSWAQGSWRVVRELPLRRRGA